tara:strand:- start:1146 stop:1520 length:375 start_codon:yes stop_codon:yes gene_type:complete
LNPKVLNPNIYSNIKSNDIIKKLISQIYKTRFLIFLLEFSKKNFIANTKKRNLEKPIDLVKELSKLLLKYKLIINEIHKRKIKIKNLFLIKSKFLFLIVLNKNKIQITIVFILINKLPSKKHSG